MIPNGKQRQKTSCICKVCGKEGIPQVIRDHIEANHLEGISLSCDACDKTCPSRASLKMHKRKFHSQSASIVAHYYASLILQLGDKILMINMIIRVTVTKLKIPLIYLIFFKLTNIRYHIESNHVEGISIPCDICDKTYSSRASLRMHKYPKE